MKAVSLFLLLALSIQLQSQDSIVFENNVMNLDQMSCLLDDYQIEDRHPTIFEHNRLGPFKAAFFKSYENDYVLVEVDPSSEYAFLLFVCDSIKVKTNLKRFVIPAAVYSVEIRYAPCKYVRTAIDASSCKSELSYTLIPPSSPYDDDGILIINPPSKKSNWYFEHDNDQIVGDTLYNVHSGYYKIRGATSNKCKTVETIPVIYKGGDVTELESFDFESIVLTKG